ncbi:MULTISPECIES: hypothetical protein [unclassified Variovorax]|uniref:hypothetical protein n=1 Tax=unclassified Variovorax TaxID=663243 RepID=UPI0011AF3952|nr:MULTISPECIES: hypothetical protein [unclassified Variovorax]
MTIPDCRQKKGLCSPERPQATQPLLYSRPGFQILADGTVLLAPPVSTDGPTHVHRMVDWVLRREDPDTRALIFKAIESNRTGVDIPALREGLRLSSRLMDVLRNGFENSHLRRLRAEQLPCSSSPQAVVEALQQEVQRMHSCLSMRDVLALAKFAASEIERRSSGEQVPTEHQALYLYKSMAMSDCFKGRALDDDPLLKREMGPIEGEVDNQPAKAKDALAPLLNASARWLDWLLSQAASGAAPLPQQQKKNLAKSILTAYAVLLGHCFAEGDAGPQRMHDLLQHHVRAALDMLETEDEPADTSRKRKAGQLDAPPAAAWSIENSRQQALADVLHVAATARAKLTGEFELQEGLRCLQHAFNNGWSNWLALYRPGTPFARLSLPDQAHELGRIDAIDGPDGHPMQRLRLMPGQLRALMPELEAHLDLAIVFKGPTNLHFGDSRVDQTHHYTALIKVNDVHFELESLAANAQAGKCWIPNLRAYFERLQGGAYMAIRGADNALSKYVKLMAIEAFSKTCEALGVLLGKQPIIELAKFLPVGGMEDAARQIDSDFAAEFCRSGLSLPNATSHETDVPHGNGRSKAIVDWLGTLGTNEAILWTGTDPMVTAVVRAATGEWFALDSASMSRRSLLEVLDGQQALFKGLAPDEHKERAGFARALTLVAPAAPSSSPALAPGAVQELAPVAVVDASVLPRPGKDEIARSEKTLLLACKMYERYRLNVWTNPIPKFDTGKKIIDYVLGIDLDPKQFGSLLTISRAVSSSNVTGSQHIAALYLLRGGHDRVNGDLLELLPSEVPPCLVPYRKTIQANVLTWRERDRGSRVLAKLGLSGPLT